MTRCRAILLACAVRRATQDRRTISTASVGGSRRKISALAGAAALVSVSIAASVGAALGGSRASACTLGSTRMPNIALVMSSPVVKPDEAADASETSAACPRNA